MVKKEKKQKVINLRVDEDLYKLLKSKDNYSKFIRNKLIRNKLGGESNSKCKEDLDFLRSLFETGKVTINRKEITEKELRKLDEI